MTALADLMVRRRKMTLRVKDMTSAMGKAHHTSSNCRQQHHQLAAHGDDEAVDGVANGLEHRACNDA